jgi:hypothetical protein
MGGLYFVKSWLVQCSRQTIFHRHYLRQKVVLLRCGKALCPRQQPMPRILAEGQSLVLRGDMPVKFSRYATIFA